jgi:hypothetical protein
VDDEQEVMARAYNPNAIIEIISFFIGFRVK